MSPELSIQKVYILFFFLNLKKKPNQKTKTQLIYFLTFVQQVPYQR